jgi:hypothetical protein
VAVTVRSLFEFFPLYREQEPREGEVLELTLVGHPQGAAGRQTRRVLVYTGTFMLAFVALSFVVDGALWWAPVVLILGALSVVLLVVVTTRAADLPVGVVLSNRRVLVAQCRRRAEPVVRAELGPEAITWAQIIVDVEPIWFPGTVIRIVLGGPDDTIVVVLDLPRFEPSAARRLFEEARLEVRPTVGEGAYRGADDVRDLVDPLWLVKAVPVGVLYTFGVVCGLLAIPVASDDGAASAAAAVAIGVVLVGAGDVLRRLLFRRRRA